MQIIYFILMLIDNLELLDIVEKLTSIAFGLCGIGLTIYFAAQETKIERMEVLLSKLTKANEDNAVQILQLDMLARSVAKQNSDYLKSIAPVIILERQFTYKLTKKASDIDADAFLAEYWPRIKNAGSGVAKDVQIRIVLLQVSLGEPIFTGLWCRNNYDLTLPSGDSYPLFAENYIKKSVASQFEGLKVIFHYRYINAVSNEAHNETLFYRHTYSESLKHHFDRSFESEIPALEKFVKDRPDLFE